MIMEIKSSSSPRSAAAARFRSVAIEASYRVRPHPDVREGDGAHRATPDLRFNIDLVYSTFPGEPSMLDIGFGTREERKDGESVATCSCGSVSGSNPGSKFQGQESLTDTAIQGT